MLLHLSLHLCLLLLEPLLLLLLFRLVADGVAAAVGCGWGGSGGCGVVALGGVEGGSARSCSRFSLTGSSHARDMESGIALGNANSCADTANSLLVERCRKVRLRSTVGMSPAPAAGTYRRSADKVHDQRQVSRKR